MPLRMFRARSRGLHSYEHSFGKEDTERCKGITPPPRPSCLWRCALEKKAGIAKGVAGKAVASMRRIIKILAAAVMVREGVRNGIQGRKSDVTPHP
jgi:hypothetical protein